MKKKLSRIIAMLLAVVMVIAGITIVPKTETKAAAGKPSFTVKTDVKEMHPGDTVHVEFWLNAGADVMQFIGGFDFDTNVYTYVANSLKLNNDMVIGAITNGGQAIVDQSDVYTAGGFSVLFDNMTKPFTGGVKVFEFDVTVNKDAKGSGLMRFNCVGCQTGSSDNDRQDVAAEDVISVTQDSNGNVFSGSRIPVVIDIESFAIDQADFSMDRGESEKLTATVKPEAALEGKTITWSSSDKNVVTVDQEGNVKAVGNGTATITAKVENFTDSVTITVKSPLTSITLNTQETSIKKGDSATLEVIFNPADTTDAKDVKWTSSNPSVATVDQNGKVTALKDGTAVITATVGSLKAECTVHVREVPLKGIGLDKTAISLNKGMSSDKLVVSYNPEDTTDDKTVTWSTSDASVATVKDGVVTAVGAGKATITAKVGKYTAECKVSVLSPLVSISIESEDSTDTMEVGDTADLDVKYNPTDTTDEKSVTWSTSDASVATVDEDGVVTAVAGGTATITATSNANNEIKAVREVKVLKHIESISLSKQEISLVKGQSSEAIIVTINPADADDSKDVTWSTSDASVATVKDGVVTAVGAGKATITAKVGKITAECKVSVLSPLVSISIESEDPTDAMEVGDTADLKVKYNPADTTDEKSVTWSTSDASVATVDEDGVVTAVAGGTATITATSNADSEIKATCSVKVLKHTESISLSKNEITLVKGKSSDTVTVTFNPADTDDSKNVEWTTSDASVATVKDGVVTGVAEGTATITATAVSGQKTVSDSLKVTVKEIHVEDANLEETTPSELYIGQAYDIQVVTTPAEVTDNVKCTYESSDENVATVDKNGTVHAIAAGTAEITVTVKSGSFTKDLTFTLTVKEIPLESIALKQEVTPLEEGQTAQLEVIFNPENTTVDKTITWTSSDESVATVDENGLLTAVKAGTTTISATVGSKEVSYELTVTEKKETTDSDESGSHGNNGQSGQAGNNGQSGQTGNNGQGTNNNGQNSGDKVNNQNNDGTVQTGDTANIFGIMLTMLISLSVAVLVVVYRSRGKRIL